MVNTVKALILDLGSLNLPNMNIRFVFCIYNAQNVLSKSHLLNKCAEITDIRTQHILKYGLKCMQSRSDTETVYCDIYVSINFICFINFLKS